MGGGEIGKERGGERKNKGEGKVEREFEGGIGREGGKGRYINRNT